MKTCLVHVQRTIKLGKENNGKHERRRTTLLTLATEVGSMQGRKYRKIVDKEPEQMTAESGERSTEIEKKHST
jgi:hypothetical protein